MTRSKIQLIKTDRTWSTISSLIRSFHISLSCFLTKISNKQNMSNKHINLGSSWQWTGCGLESVPWSVLTPILISCTIFKSIIMWVNMSLDFTLPSFFRLHPFGSIYIFHTKQVFKVLPNKDQTHIYPNCSQKKNKKTKYRKIKITQHMRRSNLFAIEHVRSSSQDGFHTTRVFEVHKAKPTRLSRRWVHDNYTVQHFSKPTEVLQQRCWQHTRPPIYANRLTVPKNWLTIFIHMHPLPM